MRSPGCALLRAAPRGRVLKLGGPAGEAAQETAASRRKPLRAFAAPVCARRCTLGVGRPTKGLRRRVQLR
eukprot:15483618-Alexandrium_andersonii.AAC.1